jgi:formylglycine-generating enzyme required for sulfatase activity
MAEAEKACQLLNGPTAPYSSTGWRLCTASDWQAACKGTGNTIFPYGASYVKADCNGNDYEAAIGNTTTAPAPIPTGSAGSCASVISTSPSLKLFDMSGNVKEWTLTDLTSKNPLSNPGCSTPPCLFELRGGAYDINSFTIGSTTSAPGLQCDASIPAPYSTTIGADGGTMTQGIDVRLPSVGFRCCLPGQLPQ